METQMRTSRTVIPKGLREKEQKLTQMLFIIFACFMLSYGPGSVIKIVSIFQLKFALIQTVQFQLCYSKCMEHINSYVMLCCFSWIRTISIDIVMCLHTLPTGHLLL